MDFIFMLTRSDQTVSDCLDVLQEIESVHLQHIGFKDIGVPPTTLMELNRHIKAMGATSYMEVVSTSKESALRSASVAKEIGVDRLLGGTYVTETLDILKASAVSYYPFPGKPFDHPTKLGGSPTDVANDCQRFQRMGCAGVDLLAYRATESNPIDLVKSARQALSPQQLLIVAGSVSKVSQIQDLKKAGADAFTIGSAAFDGSFSPLKGSLRSQLRDIIDACR